MARCKEGQCICIFLSDFTQRLGSPQNCFSIASGEKVSHSYPVLPKAHGRIEGTKPHGVLYLFATNLKVAKANLQKAISTPENCEIGIEQTSPLYQLQSTIQIIA